MVTREELRRVRFVVNAGRKGIRVDKRFFKAMTITSVIGAQLAPECYIKYMRPDNHVLFFAETQAEAKEILKREQSKLQLKRINPRLVIEPEVEISSEPIVEPIPEVTIEPIPEVVDEPTVDEVIETLKEEIIEPKVEEEIPVEEEEAPVEEGEDEYYSKMSKSDLRELCKEKGIDSSGNKKDLIERLKGE